MSELSELWNKLGRMPKHEANRIKASVDAFFKEKAYSIQKTGGIPPAITQTDYAKALAWLINRYVPEKNVCTFGEGGDTVKQVREFQIQTGHSLRPVKK
jgi:Zn-dependent M16 (insulinase) family peptidase